jgi:hypothetical protein
MIGQASSLIKLANRVMTGSEKLSRGLGGQCKSSNIVQLEKNQSSLWKVKVPSKHFFTLASCQRGEMSTF